MRPACPTGTVLSSATLLVAALATCVPQTAVAEQGFNVHGLRVRPNRLQGFVASSSARVLGRQGWSVGLVSGHAQRPLVVAPDRLTDSPYAPNGRIVTSQTVAELVAAYGVFDFLELGIVAPLVLAQDGETAAGLADPNALDAGVGFSDVWLSTKAALVTVGATGPSLSLAAEAGVGIPSGDRSTFQGGGTQVEPRAVLEGRIPGGPTLTANLGYAWREPVSVGGIEVRDEPLWAVGLAVPILDWLSVVAETFRTTSTEALLACNLSFGPARLEIGGGLGLNDDAGTPDWRAFAGLSLGSMGEASDALFVRGEPAEPRIVVVPGGGAAPETRGAASSDEDGDGFTDRTDGCPKAAEDIDGFEDRDGCPDPDNDDDGVPDLEDRCPRDAGPKTGVERSGCPSWGPGDIDTVVFFAPYTSRLSAMARHSVGVVARALLATAGEPHLWVVGHADRVGDVDLERRLSVERAEAVRAQLIEEGVPPGRATSIGAGAALLQASPGEDPVVNRRVEFDVAPRDEPPKFPTPQQGPVSPPPASEPPAAPSGPAAG